jgi:serine/threonine-protein kinase
MPQKPAGMIRWYFSTTPAGAQVFVDDEPRGLTPTSVYVPIGEEPVDVRLELAGYEPLPLALPPTNDQLFSPRMQPLAVEPVVSSKVSKRVRKVSKDRSADKSPNQHKSGDKAGDEPAGETGSGPGKTGFVPVPESLRDADD